MKTQAAPFGSNRRPPEENCRFFVALRTPIRKSLPFHSAGKWMAQRNTCASLPRMKSVKTGAAILAAVTFLGTATTIAQSDVGTGGSTTPAAVEDERPNYTPLLGLLGLLGLMGLKRRRDTRLDNDVRR